MTDRVAPTDLRLPADMLILYYCYVNGQGMPGAIAATIERNPDYIATRTRSLLETPLLERVVGETGPVTLTEAGVDFVAEHESDSILPRDREPIDAATDYSVTWR
ncbi:hypothetical protein [Natrinema versiforme]|uniref:Uncharacterized protein n=1 Tax=Natrinema versiforme JCM 10478 TaxID=1227496 RepID=L9Y462_9EURY|nr:hypothetical protein [Natrinema versiforme]ELY68855.1 hypothetical protein C489_05798 [Natrinema versiforme JCM 10478]